MIGKGSAGYPKCTLWVSYNKKAAPRPGSDFEDKGYRTPASQPYQDSAGHGKCPAPDKQKKGLQYHAEYNSAQ